MPPKVDDDSRRRSARDGHARPLLLVSVRDAAEAADALAGGADWIDLKEPLDGPLGAVSAAVAHDVAAIAGAHAPLSAAAGELVDWPTAASRDLLAVAGVSLIKLGLAGCRGQMWQTPWRQAQTEISAAGKHLVAAAYADFVAADAPSPFEILNLAIDAACPWVLVDTFDKRSGPLGAHFAPHELAAWLTAARSASCGTAVAGRLDHAAIRQMPMNLVDVVAVRGAACEGARTSRVSRRRVAELVQLLSLVGSPGTPAMRISRLEACAPHFQ